jgi:CHASE3 domain sensor protein
MSEQIIANALGLRPLEEVKKQIIDVDAVVMPDDEPGTEVVAYEEKYPDVPEPDKEVLEDIDYAKKNIKDIIEKGKDSLDELIAIAKQTESARAFEVASNIMKTMLDANRQLIDTSKEKKYEKSEQPSNHTTNVTNNTLMLTTEEMLTMLKNKRLGDA